ncbi:MAG: hypothetical protein RBR06_04460 [Desulfuromonadaceae bacterium]|nr:hypothetical protein [Desulfuromonadaceae bacterium]
MDKIIKFAGTIGIVAFIFISVSCKEKDMIVVAEDSISIYKSYPDSGIPDEDTVIATLTKGVTGDIIKTEHSKDFMFYMIRIKDGRIGYVWFGDKFKVVQKP